MRGWRGARWGAESAPPPTAFPALKYTTNTVRLNKICLQATWEALAYDFSSGGLLNERVKNLQGNHCKSLREARRKRGQNSKDLLFGLVYTSQGQGLPLALLPPQCSAPSGCTNRSIRSAFTKYGLCTESASTRQWPPSRSSVLGTDRAAVRH